MYYNYNMHLHSLLSDCSETSGVCQMPALSTDRFPTLEKFLNSLCRLTLSPAMVRSVQRGLQINFQLPVSAPNACLWTKTLCRTCACWCGLRGKGVGFILFPDMVLIRPGLALWRNSRGLKQKGKGRVGWWKCAQTRISVTAKTNNFWAQHTGNKYSRVRQL